VADVVEVVLGDDAREVGGVHNIAGGGWQWQWVADGSWQVAVDGWQLAGGSGSG
jgi:hypothetical protein